MGGNESKQVRKSSAGAADAPKIDFKDLLSRALGNKVEYRNIIDSISRQLHNAHQPDAQGLLLGLNELDLNHSIHFLKLLATASHFFHPAFDENGENRIKEVITKDRSDIKLQKFVEDELASILSHGSGIDRWMQRLFESFAHPNQTTMGVNTVKSDIITDTEFFLISQVSPNASQLLGDSNRPCHLLYSINQHGESWIRFVDLVASYAAPVLVCIKCEDGSKCGAFIPGGLNESGTRFFGTSDTFLFSLAPRFTVCRATGGGEGNYCLLNQRSEFAPRGLGFGGSTDGFRLYLSSDLKQVSASVCCRTYRSGALINMKDTAGDDGDEDLYQKTVKVEEVELWGFGDANDLLHQEESRNRLEETKYQQRQVDRAAFFEGMDRDLLSTKAPVGGERQGEVERIVEERKREKKEKEGR